MTIDPSPVRVLVTGASGYLGRHLLAQAPSHWHITACYHHTPIVSQGNIQALALDITDNASIGSAFAKARPDIVIHAAIARDEACFDAVIVDGSRNIAQMAQRSGTKLIHMSTDVLFDGSAKYYTEEDKPAPEPAADEPDPLTAYGRAKARAENEVLNACSSTLLVRTSIIYGFRPLDHSTRWLHQGISDGSGVTLFTDQIRCPIYAPDLAAALIELVDVSVHEDLEGALHLVGPKALSRYHFGLLLCEALELNAETIIDAPMPADAPWPKRLHLLADRAQRQLTFRPRSPQQVANDFRQTTE